MRWITAWCWVEIISTQHLMAISTRHPDRKYSYDTLLSGTCHDLTYWSKVIILVFKLIKTTENQPQAAHGHAMTRRFPHSAMMDAGWNSREFHDDVIKWKYFPRHWPFVRRIHRLPVNSPHKGQWCGALMFSLMCAWTNRWANNGEAVIWDAIALTVTPL